MGPGVAGGGVGILVALWVAVLGLGALGPHALAAAVTTTAVTVRTSEDPCFVRVEMPSVVLAAGSIVRFAEPNGGVPKTRGKVLRREEGGRLVIALERKKSKKAKRRCVDVSNLELVASDGKPLATPREVSVGSGAAAGLDVFEARLGVVTASAATVGLAANLDRLENFVLMGPAMRLRLKPLAFAERRSVGNLLVLGVGYDQAATTPDLELRRNGRVLGDATYARARLEPELLVGADLFGDRLTARLALRLVNEKWKPNVRYRDGVDAEARPLRDFAVSGLGVGLDLAARPLATLELSFAYAITSGVEAAVSSGEDGEFTIDDGKLGGVQGSTIDLGLTAFVSEALGAYAEVELATSQGEVKLRSGASSRVSVESRSLAIGLRADL